MTKLTQLTLMILLVLHGSVVAVALEIKGGGAGIDPAALQPLCKQQYHYDHIDLLTEPNQTVSSDTSRASLCLCGTDFAAMEPSLSINTTSSPPLANAQHTGFHDLLLQEAFCRIGKKITIPRLSGRTSLNLANQGIDDGTALRIIAMLKEPYPNLLPIPESIMTFDFVAFSRRDDIEISGWSSLEPYNVAFNRGWIILEKNITQAKSITMTKDSEQLFNLLKNDRVDIIVYEKWEGLQHLKHYNIEGGKLLAPPLASKKLHAFLHMKHQALLEPLAQALAEMKADGSYWPIYFQTLAPLVTE